MKNLIIIASLAWTMFSFTKVNAQTPLTNTFSYQGELKFNNVIANGSYDFEFSVFDVPTAGTALETVTVMNVTVTNGVFTTPITLTNDLFFGNKIWLDIGVRVFGATSPFEPLSPRQEVTSSPYAIHAQFVDLSTIPSWNIGGNAAATGDFIGTTNAKPFIVKVNSKQVLSIFDGVEMSSNHSPSIIIGADSNSMTGTLLGSTISGGVSNIASSDGVTISGGSSNQGSGFRSTIGGGLSNRASGFNSTITGGSDNNASGDFTTISGINGLASARYSTIGGGTNNIVSGENAVVSGGDGNDAIGYSSVVGGGSFNESSGRYSTVSGGGGNLAGGDYSFAAGRGAQVRDAATTGTPKGDEGTFIWAGDNGFTNFTSTGSNQFRVRATGGAYFEVTGAGLSPPGFHIEQKGASGVGMLIRQTSSDANLVLVNKGTGDLIKAFTGIGGGNLMFRVANSGNVTADGSFTGGGADFAEYLPAVDNTLKKGEVVGLRSGKVSRNTSNVERIFVVSTSPAFVGNKQQDNTSPKALVAFTGQVPVNVEGKVLAGDWLLASGNNDGKAKAIHNNQIAAANFSLIIGRAITNSHDGQVSVLVGLPQQTLIAVQQQTILQLQQQQNIILAQLKDTQSLRQELAEIKSLLLSPSVQPLLAQNNKENQDE